MGENIAQIKESPGKNTICSAELLAEGSNIIVGILRFRFGAIKDTAGCTGDGADFSQTERFHHFAKQINIFTHGRFGRGEQLTEVGKGEQVVGRI